MLAITVANAHLFWFDRIFNLSFAEGVKIRPQNLYNISHFPQLSWGKNWREKQVARLEASVGKIQLRRWRHIGVSRRSHCARRKQQCRRRAIFRSWLENYNSCCALIFWKFKPEIVQGADRKKTTWTEGKDIKGFKLSGYSLWRHQNFRFLLSIERAQWRAHFQSKVIYQRFFIRWTWFWIFSLVVFLFRNSSSGTEAKIFPSIR